MELAGKSGSSGWGCSSEQHHQLGCLGVSSRVSSAWDKAIRDGPSADWVPLCKVITYH